MRGGVNNPMSAEEGGIPRPFGGYQSNMRPASPDTVWPIHSFVPKNEPVEHEDRNDSGINSASDFHSSSPGSDRSENIPYSSPPNTQITPHQMHQSSYYSTPVMGINPLHHIYNYQNPTTSPYLDTQNNNNPKSSGPLEEKSETLTQQRFPLSPSTSSNMPGPSQPQTSLDNVHPENPLRKLQMALENNSLLSPKSNDYSCEDETKSENDGEGFDEQDLKVPKVNSHGKVRTHKCKQCDFVAITKYEYYEHIKKEHIKASKLLTCSKCPFVTEYKHHFEYHLRNHMGCKPFKCPQCSYTCVNKSMLSSHKKSHSNIYQYRCATCHYATKYCHSLKTHLRKYNHEPAMVLNPDGTPNPLPIIDVYGKRRGPKLKTQEQKPAEELNTEQFLPFPFNQMMFAPSQLNVPLPGFPFLPGLPGVIQQSLFQNLERIAQEQGGLQPPQEPAEESSASSQPDSEVLDLSKPEKTSRSRRKGRAFKLTPSHENSSDEEEETTMFSNVEVVEEKEDQQAPPMEEECQKPEEEVSNDNGNKSDFRCQYCSICFEDAILHSMHMGYHNRREPFTCNNCGEECNDKFSFFLHIARSRHS